MRGRIRKKKFYCYCSTSKCFSLHTSSLIRLLLKGTAAAGQNLNHHPCPPPSWSHLWISLSTGGYFLVVVVLFQHSCAAHYRNAWYITRHPTPALNHTPHRVLCCVNMNRNNRVRWILVFFWARFTFNAESEGVQILLSRRVIICCIHLVLKAF